MTCVFPSMWDRFGRDTSWELCVMDGNHALSKSLLHFRCKNETIVWPSELSLGFMCSLLPTFVSSFFILFIISWFGQAMISHCVYPDWSNNGLYKSQLAFKPELETIAWYGLSKPGGEVGIWNMWGKAGGSNVPIWGLFSVANPWFCCYIRAEPLGSGKAW